MKGSIAVKVFGKDLYRSEKIAMEIDKILGTVEGIEDLGVIRNIGQPELRIELDEGRLATLRGIQRGCAGHYRNGHRRKVGFVVVRR